MKKIYILIYFSLCLAGIGKAQYTDLFNFPGAPNESSPEGSLVFDGTFLYGMTFYGGTNNNGAIFKIKPDGTGYSKLLDFAGATNGAAPFGSLIYDGVFLYGMTSAGGIKDSGVVFKIKPDGTGYYKLLDFAGATNGATPFGALIYDGSFLYGMTSAGGIKDSGVVFKIKPDGTGYTKLLDFTGPNGANPRCDLTLAGNVLYGMTRSGGLAPSISQGGPSFKCGTIFSIHTDGSGYSDLLDFNGTNGLSPTSSLIVSGNVLYGITHNGARGNGRIFSIHTDGTGFTTLKDIDQTMQNSLIQSGNVLYGMTDGGNWSGSYYGSIFSINTDGTGFNTMFDFNSANDLAGASGGFPQGSLILLGNVLYGVAYGGANNGGVVFSFNTNTSGVGIVAGKESEINVFPNPANNFVTIKFSSLTNYTNTRDQLLVTIKNNLSQTVYEENKKDFSGKYINTIDLSKQPKGIYFVEMVLGSERRNRKIILE